MDLATWFWPKVSDRKNAQFAINEVFFAAVVAVLTAIMATVEALKDTTEGLGAEGFANAILFGGVAFGIYRSRIAAVSALALYLVGRGYAWVTVGPKVAALPVLVTLAFLNGVRGTFSYDKLPPRPKGLPSLAQSFGALERNPAESGKVDRPREGEDKADSSLRSE
jgi:hypothetical protein